MLKMYLLINAVIILLSFGISTSLGPVQSNTNDVLAFGPALFPKKRIWNFTAGQFELIPTDEVHEIAVPGNGRFKRKILPATTYTRTKWFGLAQPITPELEIGLYIDKAMLALFRGRYKYSAIQHLRRYIQVVFSSAQRKFHDKSLSPHLTIRLVKLQFYDGGRFSKGTDAPYSQIEAVSYLENFCELTEPLNSGFDVAVLITGHHLYYQWSGKHFLSGRAMGIQPVCTNRACVVLDGYEAPYRNGHTLSHEIGHILGMRHDGPPDHSDCSSTCCVMARSVTSAKWSSCSVRDWQKTLEILGPNSCLYDPWLKPEVLPSLKRWPGQLYPDEAQCHQAFGTCYRSVPGYEGNCTQLHCTAHRSSAISKTYVNYFRLDGSYCGPDKVCGRGQCARVQRKTSRDFLKLVDGGWSKWTEDTDAACSPSKGCSQCKVEGQLRIRVEMRRCDSPYPSNGGKACLGTQVRAKKCHQCAGMSCTPCKSNGYKALSSKLSYADEKCRVKWKSTAKSGAASQSGCEYTCSATIMSDMEHTYWFPSASPCRRDGKDGICALGNCLLQLCSEHEDYFVDSDTECNIEPITTTTLKTTSEDESPIPVGAYRKRSDSLRLLAGGPKQFSRWKQNLQKS